MIIDDKSVIEKHPLPPFLPPHTKLLMLGSFPPPRARWKMDFYYPNLQNDMWRIFGLVFFADRDYFITTDGKGYQEKKIRDFLYEKGIAISDTALRIERLKGNASDKFLRIIEPMNLYALLLQLPQCTALMTTGELATRTLLSLLPEKTLPPTIENKSTADFAGRQISLYRLPSSSRAYPLPLMKKAERYRAFFCDMEML